MYFHDVLHRLAKHPPAKARDAPIERGGTGDYPGPPLMPQFSPETYNTLVHYALRYCMSLDLALDLIQHMELVSPGLKARYHNFLRSGTLLRRNYLYPLLWRPRMGKLWYHGAMSEAERLIQCIGDSHPTCAKSLANRGLVGMQLLHCPGISGLTSSRLNCI